MSGSDGRLRAGDDDRRRVLARLEQAHGEGRIDLAEFDERAALTWSAKTFEELSPLTADLPGSPSRPRNGSRHGRDRHGRDRADWRRCSGLRVARSVNETAWIAAVLVNFVIWALVSLGNEAAVYPWWIWVAGPWGAVLLAARIIGVGRRSDQADGSGLRQM